MPSRESTTRGEGRSGSSKEIFPRSLTRGARSGARRLGCEQPMNTMEVFIPKPSRPGVHMPQGAQVTKTNKPCAIGQPGGGHAAVVREIAVPRGDRGKDSGSG